jgi:hypothetical protein
VRSSEKLLPSLALLLLLQTPLFSSARTLEELRLSGRQYAGGGL